MNYFNHSINVHLKRLLAMAATLFIVSGCKQQENSSTSASSSYASATNSSSASTAAGDASTGGSDEFAAMATVSSTKGNNAKGTVKFATAPDGVRVVAEITGLTPGVHGFHVHQNGDCSAPDASSAGGHYNPLGVPHGGPMADQHHMGDLGNITADASGKASLDKVFSFLKLSGTNSVVGHAIVVHGGEDDLKSQPSGNAGPRVGCGVIKETSG